MANNSILCQSDSLYLQKQKQQIYNDDDYDILSIVKPLPLSCYHVRINIKFNTAVFTAAQRKDTVANTRSEIQASSILHLKISSI